VVKNRSSLLVASTGIEPVSGASETLILSIVLRGHSNSCKGMGLTYKLKENNRLKL
jgi:hypothetical protein